MPNPQLETIEFCLRILEQVEKVKLTTEQATHIEKVAYANLDAILGLSK